MDIPWKVLLAFVGVFIAGAVFGGVFTVGVSARRFSGNPRPAADRPLTQYPAVTQPKTQVAGPHLPKAAASRANPITPVLMNQFMRKLKGLSETQRESIRKTLGRAGEDLQRLRQENFADVARVTDRMFADVSSILSPEQRGELETMRLQNEQRMQDARKKRMEAAATEAAARSAGNAAPAAHPVTPESPAGTVK